MTWHLLYLNNKISYRENGNISSAPWLFDEPVNTRDFMALRWYGRLWRKAVDPVGGPAQLWFRADISYPGFSRDLLWGITDIAYYGGLDDRSVRFADNRRMLHRRPFYFAEYGSANKIAASNTGTAVWCLDAWFRGKAQREERPHKSPPPKGWSENKNFGFFDGKSFAFLRCFFLTVHADRSTLFSRGEL
jgi:hypothetical protein